jgi:putative hemolysin
VRARTWMVLAVMVGLSAAGCAPSIEGAGENGGTIHESQLTLDHPEFGPLALPVGDKQSNVVAIAGKYCSQYGRSAHLTSEDVGPFWMDTFTFDCQP